MSAAAEAAIVGGLADWFAITALFRHPLGLPIPHTALIASKKDDIGRSLGEFVRDKILDPTLILERLGRENRALQLANWLQAPDTAHFVAERVVTALPIILNTINDAQVHRFVRDVARERLHRLKLLPTFDAALNALIGAGKHMELIDLLLNVSAPALKGNRHRIITKIGQRTGRWIPKFVDRKLAESLIDAVDKWAVAIGTHGDPERIRLDVWIQESLEYLRGMPNYPTMIEEAKRALVSQPALIHSLETIWDEIKHDMMDDAASPSPKVGIMSAELIQTIGRLLEESPAMQQYLNTAIDRILIDYITPWRVGIGNYIADVVASWNGPKVAALIELQVGKDLQYVRVNGTVVGALIGCILFLIGAALPQLVK